MLVRAPMAIGCYCYRTDSGITVIHQFVDGEQRCGCGVRTLRSMVKQ